MNGLIGREVAFMPYHVKDTNNGTRKFGEITVRGVIDYVNEQHGYFAIAYRAGSSKQHECFKLRDIGEDVTLTGRKKNC